MSAAKTRPRTPRPTGATLPRAAGAGAGAKKKRAKPRRPQEADKTPEAKDAAKVARALSGKAARYLRGLGHHLEPVVQIGKDGITEGVVAATREALLAHELVKVRVLAEAPIDRKLAGPELSDRVGAALAQTLGRTLLLYKRHPQKPKIVVPR